MEPAKVYEIVWAFGLIGVGIVSIFFRKWGIKHNVKGFQSLYEKTGFPLFRRQAEEMGKPYMNILTLVIGVLLLAIGLAVLTKNL